MERQPVRKSVPARQNSGTILNILRAFMMQTSYGQAGFVSTKQDAPSRR
jgi:hypothetical protein